MEYACPVWHSSLTATQCDALEMVQKQAICIIYSDRDYNTSLIVAGIDIGCPVEAISYVYLFTRLYMVRRWSIYKNCASQHQVTYIERV